MDFNESTFMGKRHTSSTRAIYVKQFHQSGLTQSEFCRQHGLVLKTFNKWVIRNTLKGTDGPKSDIPRRKGGEDHKHTHTFQGTFIPIHVDDSESQDFRSAPCLKRESLGYGKNIDSSSPCKVDFYQSALCFKTNRFSLDLTLDLGTDYGKTALKSVIHTLHQLPGE